MKYCSTFSRRTKIVCTIGPASGSTAELKQLIKAGMNVARLNLSHGTYEDHGMYISRIRKISLQLKTRVGILIDLPGPKYRTGDLKNGQAILKKRAQITITTKQVEGDASLVSVNIPDLPREIHVGDLVLVDDGAMELRVLSKTDTEVKCRVIAGGTLINRRGLVVPGMHTSTPFITDALKDYLNFAVGQQPDYLALSFVNTADDVEQVRNLIKKRGASIPLISKIERVGAVKRFDSILAASDGIMVARGDLGVDIPLEKVPGVQKEIIRKCNQVGKPVITATQMLESMINSINPTRAEVTDVANAIFDGTDATMLSGETSVGKYPTQAVLVMAKIAREIEGELPYEKTLVERSRLLEHKTEELISYNACLTAQNLRAAAIVAFTLSGSTAGRVSKFRPEAPILAISPSSAVCGRLMLWWGVYPFQVADPPGIAELFATASTLVKEQCLANPGNLVVITGGIPMGIGGSTNLLKVEKVS